MIGSVALAQNMDTTKVQKPKTFEMQWKDSTFYFHLSVQVLSLSVQEMVLP